MTRRRLQGAPTDDTAYGHLLPVLEAELSWGNTSRRGFEYHEREGVWSAYVDRPLHVDLLREHFEFPAHVELRDGARTAVVDVRNRVSVTSLSSTGPLGPPRRERQGLWRRILGP